MPSRSRRAAPLHLFTFGVALAGSCVALRAAEEPPHPASLDEAIIKSAARHGVPESLVRRVVMRESKYNPHARNRSFWGLMQISYPTAKSMGFRGTPQELLNPVVNLRYAVPYLANAFVIAGKRQDAAVRLYAHGYYEAAKRRGLLGALRTADSTPMSGVPEEPDTVAVATVAPQPEESGGLFGALFGPQQMQRDTQTEQAVYASAPPAPTPVNETAPPTPAPRTIADRGDAHPTEKQRDGGISVIARGEQSIDHVAAYAKSADAADAHGRRRHSRKVTVFASLDAPPTTAQAYAATAGGQDPRMMQADSQTAIAQATAGQRADAPAPTDQPVAAQADTAPVKAVADDETSRKGHKKRIAHRTRHHEVVDAPETAATAPAPAPAADAPQQTAVGGAPQTVPVQQAAAAPQANSVDASGRPVPAWDPAAVPQQTADAASESASPASKQRRRKTHAAHARTHKAQDVVATQTLGDGANSPAPTQQPAQTQ